MTSNELQALRRLLSLSVAEAAEHIGGMEARSWNRLESGIRGIPERIPQLMFELVDQRQTLLDKLTQEAKSGPGKQFLYFRSFEESNFSDVLQWRIYQSVIIELFGAGLCSIE